jgi:hypothetical protein
MFPPFLFGSFARQTQYALIAPVGSAGRSIHSQLIFHSLDKMRFNCAAS